MLGGGLINLKIEPEVSQLDTSHPVQVAGISVPPLIVRRASTTVELRDGQSFVIGGLLQSNGQNAISQLPWLGDVPVLGALFRSTSYQKNETDLAIIVTPRLVRPARPGDVIKTPLDCSLPPNDADLFLMGKTEITAGHGAADRRHPAARIHRSHARSAEGRRQCGLGRATRLTAAAALLGCSARRLLGHLLRPPRRHLGRLRRGEATNRVTHMIDPWPAASGRRNIAYSGEKAAIAAERYRTGRVIPPVNATTSSAAYTQAQQPRSRRSTARPRRRRRSNNSKPTSRSECRRTSSAANKTGVVVLTADPAFEQSARSTFGASGQIELRVVSGTVAEAGDLFDTDGATVVDRRSRRRHAARRCRRWSG